MDTGGNPDNAHNQGAEIRDLKAQVRELSAKLFDLQDLMNTKFEAAASVNIERSTRYEQRFTSAETAVAAALAAQQVAVAAALQAQKEATAAAFAASEKAIVKAEIAQTAYNERSNEFRKALDDSNRLNISRTEAETRFNALDDKIADGKDSQDRALKELRDSIADLRESRSSGAGAQARGSSDRTQSNWVIGVAIGGGIAFVGVVIGVIEWLVRVTGH